MGVESETKDKRKKRSDGAGRGESRCYWEQTEYDQSLRWKSGWEPIECKKETSDLQPGEKIASKKSGTFVRREGVSPT